MKTIKILYKKPWRDLKDMGKRSKILFAVLALSIGFVVGMIFMFIEIMPVFESYYENSNRADYSYSTSGFNSSQIQGIQEEIPEIKDIQGKLTIQTTLNLENKDQTFHIIIVGIDVDSSFRDEGIDKNIPIYTYNMTGGKNLDVNNQKSVVLSDQFMDLNEIDIGENITFHNLGNLEVTISGQFFSIEYLMVNLNPDILFPVKGAVGIVFMEKELLIDSLKTSNPGYFFPHAEFEYSELQVVIDENADKDLINERIESYLKENGVIVIESTPFKESYAWKMLESDLEGTLEFSVVLIILTLVMAFTSSFSIFMGFAKNQSRQIGTLSSLGLPKKNIIKSYIILLLEISVIVFVLSSLIAYGLMTMIFTEISNALLGFSIFYSFNPLIIVYSIVFTLILGIFAMIPSINKMLKKDMADLLYKKENLTERVSKRKTISNRKAIHKLVLRNIIRNPKKSTLHLIGVLFSLLIVAGMLVMVSSLQYTIYDKISENENWDASISLSNPILSDDQVISDIYDIEGVSKLEIALKVQVLLENPMKDVENYSYSLMGIDDDFSMHIFDFNEEYGEDNRKFNSPFEIVIGNGLTHRLDVEIGDNITIYLQNGNILNFSIVGISEEISITSYIQLETLQDILNISNGINQIFVDFDPDATIDENSIIEEIYSVSERITNIQRLDEIIDSIKEYADLIVPFVFIIVCFAAIVEFFILYNAILTSIGDHEVEYGIMRSLGFTPKKIYWQIFMEILPLILISLTISLILIVPIAKWLLSAYEEQFAIFAHYPFWIYIATTIVPFLVVFWAAKSGLKFIYKKDLYQQVQSEFVS